MSAEQEKLETFVRGSGFEYWNRYAAVNDEFIPIHMYDEAGREAGYPTAFGMGNLTWAYVHLALHEWFGDDAVIQRVAGQFRNAVIRGTELSIDGTVGATSEEDGMRRIEVAITVKNQNGDLIAPLDAVVVTPLG